MKEIPMKKRPKTKGRPPLLLLTGPERAERALAEFTHIVYGGNHPRNLPQGDHQDAVSDLICDLLLYAFRNYMPCEAILAQARGNFEAEKADALKHYTVGSSHGELTIDAEGYVIQRRLDNEDADGGKHLESIARFDLSEWRSHWGQPMPAAFDIFDLGYWYTDSATDEAAFAPPDAKWRSEIAEILRQRRADPRASLAHRRAVSYDTITQAEEKAP
jgi:hypothetical protein